MALGATGMERGCATAATAAGVAAVCEQALQNTSRDILLAFECVDCLLLALLRLLDFAAQQQHDSFASVQLRGSYRMATTKK